jgi:flagella basal body P-ring formation protein FlgA
VLNKEQRRQRARIAALSQHAQGKTNTAVARAKGEARFREEVLARAIERGEKLTEEQIQHRTVQTRKLFFARLHFESLKARRRRGAPEGESP